MLAGNPVPRTGNQIEVGTGLISENFLNWRIPRRVERNVHNLRLHYYLAVGKCQATSHHDCTTYAYESQNSK